MKVNKMNDVERNSLLDAEEAYLRDEEICEETSYEDDFDYDIDETEELENDSDFQVIDMQKSSKFNTKKIAIVASSVAALALIVVTTVACASRRETEVPVTTDTTATTEVEAAEPEVTEPEVVVEPEVTEQQKVVSEETETAKVEEANQQEEVVDTKDLEDWLATLQIAPIFVTWNQKTNEKNLVAMGGEYVLDDDTKLILFADTVNVEKIEFLPEGIIENDTIQKKENYYIIPIMQTGKSDVEAYVSYDSLSNKYHFSIINNSTETVEVATQQSELTEEELKEWFDQVAEEYTEERAAVALWNFNDGTKEIDPFNRELQPGDNFALIFPKDFEIAEYTVDAGCTVNVNPEGNIAYLTFEDTHSGESENIIFKFTSKDGTNRNAIYSFIAP